MSNILNSSDSTPSDSDKAVFRASLSCSSENAAGDASIDSSMFTCSNKEAVHVIAEDVAIHPSSDLESSDPSKPLFSSSEGLYPAPEVACPSSSHGTHCEEERAFYTDESKIKHAALLSKQQSAGSGSQSKTCYNVRPFAVSSLLSTFGESLTKSSLTSCGNTCSAYAPNCLLSTKQLKMEPVQEDQSFIDESQEGGLNLVPRKSTSLDYSLGHAIKPVATSLVAPVDFSIAELHDQSAGNPCIVDERILKESSASTKVAAPNLLRWQQEGGQRFASSYVSLGWQLAECPAFVITQEPDLLTGSYLEYRSGCENYLRGCYWSPDGECLLTNSDDNILRLFYVADIYEASLNNLEVLPRLRMIEGETVYDMTWFPYSSSSDSLCFLTTSRDHPVHLWDATFGIVKCSYCAYDHVDELASAHSVSFNSDGAKVYCGFNKALRVFDTARPGRECTEILTYAKARKPGRRCPVRHNLGGIISCMDFEKSGSMFACGSFSKTIGLFDASSDTCFDVLAGHCGGVTQVKFAPTGVHLFSGGRKDQELLCWDLRNTSAPCIRLPRKVQTNQRIQFDIDSSGTVLASGNTDGHVSLWSLTDILNRADGPNGNVFKETASFSAHGDCVNGVSLNPVHPLLATASGQRHFPSHDSESDSDSDESGSLPIGDYSMRVWSLGPVQR